MANCREPVVGVNRCFKNAEHSGVVALNLSLGADGLIPLSLGLLTMEASCLQHGVN
ncbi:hypothetical protein MALU111345_11805 [Marinicrinis lubricantis]